METFQNFRRIGFIVLAVAAAIVTFALGNEGKSGTHGARCPISP